jgi:signal transduction histidine kinase/CheY-like chemotaxis protein
LLEKTTMLSTVTEALNTYLDTGDWNAASSKLLSFAIRQSNSEHGFLGVVLEGPVLRILDYNGIVRDIDFKNVLHEQAPVPERAEGQQELLNLDELFGQVIAKREIVIANRQQMRTPPGGLPGGEPALHAFLGVPIFKGTEVVGLIGVANRPGGYSGRELLYLETMFQTTGILCDNFRQSLKRAVMELQRERLEDQFRQAQKMEVLGRLAGGVAHDFNNMLMILGGSAELLQCTLPKGAPGTAYVEQILRTTEKAAVITKQLLAFSRKQVLNIHPVDLHEMLTESEFMLPRLLGSDIELKFHHQAANSWILSDSSQIEQVVANLAINARDAMPGGGKLTISTRNAKSLPEPGIDATPVTPPKGWVVLEVSDSGCGMDEKTRARIFEPFFTTKAEGKGTGLGLASVYGIVKQGGGHVHVDSTPGVGTKFELYFPAVEPPLHEPARERPVTREENMTATVLVVDDQVALRHAIVEILSTSGYTALEANSSLEALEIARRQGTAIDVLLTDIVMPGLRGPELARQVAALHPKMQVVFMSGYAEGLPEAQLPEGSVFLQKPFRFAILLEQIKLLLHRA